jgi:uncharacterized LabA/DUF88 family protein
MQQKSLKFSKFFDSNGLGKHPGHTYLFIETPRITALSPFCDETVRKFRDGNKIVRRLIYAGVLKHIIGSDSNSMKIYPEDRISLFIDGANLYAAARALGFDIDYKKLLQLFSEEGHMVRAYYYTALMEDQEYLPIRPLVDWLDYNGYTVVTKPTKEFTDSMGRRKIKGNMDMELAIDVLDMAEHLDHIVLFSGDGDFRRLVEAVQRKGVRVTVVSTYRSSPPMVADELRRQADRFIELSDLENKIARHAHHNSDHPVVHHAPALIDEELDDDDYLDDDEEEKVRETV